uniref:ANK_REP_REGION domain-containing protein n=1 Tax=Heterorhabditis bacteriophora TaxID=37862 RepID=A0A1I7WLB6_HETBA
MEYSVLSFYDIAVVSEDWYSLYLHNSSVGELLYPFILDNDVSGQTLNDVMMEAGENGGAVCAALLTLGAIVPSRENNLRRRFSRRNSFFINFDAVGTHTFNSLFAEAREEENRR